MMNSVNLIGRLADDVILRKTKSNKSVLNLVIANNDPIAGDVDYIPCTAWGSIAETLNIHLTKGRLISITGRIKTKVQEINGKKEYKQDVLIEKFDFLDNKADC